MVRKAFQGRIFLRACFRFCPGTAYIVLEVLGGPESYKSTFKVGSSKHLSTILRLFCGRKVCPVRARCCEV